MKCSRVLLVLFSIVVSLSLTLAQVSPVVTRVNIPQAVEKQALAVGVELARTTGINRILLKYRAFGESEFRELEMLMSGRTATATLPAEVVTPPQIEYFIEVRMEGNNVETYPLENAEANPQKVSVQAANPKDQEVRILSPESGERVAVEELVIAVSLYYASDDVNRQATRIYLDGVDVSKDAVFSDDVLLYSPRNFGRPLSLGIHFVRVQLVDTKGQEYHTVESSFGLSTATAIQEEQARLQAIADGQFEIRNEQIGLLDSTTTYIRGDLRMNGTYRALNFNLMTHIDNQEKDTRQPQNRYLLSGDVGFLRLQVGDAYPRFPSYMVSGKRVRGVTGNLALGFFNVDVSFGQTERNVDGLRLRDTTFSSASLAGTRPANSRLKSGLTYEIFQPGTFSRDFLAVRPSFGSGENFQLGFTYLKAKDDVGSIKYGLSPQENLVAGTDLMLAFDDQRIKFESQASVSITNTDISGGSFTQANYDSLKARDPKTGKDIEDLGKFAESFITINGNLTPTNPVGDGLPGVAYEAGLTLNYFNNYLQASTFRRGAAYKSFGNEFLQTDVEGLLFSDRIRMFSNRVFLNITYETRNDNTAKNKTGTTTFNNLNTLLTVLPGANLPTFSVGYGMNDQTSNATTTRPFTSTLVKAIDNQTSRFFASVNYDFTAGARQSLILSVYSSSRKDNTIFKRGQDNLSVQASLTTLFSFPLTSTVGYVLSNNKNQNQLFRTTGVDSTLTTTEFNFSTATVGLLYKLFDERLQLTAVASPTLGAFSRTTIRGGIGYNFPNRHSLEALFDYIQNGGAKDDSIGSFVYRFYF